MYINGNHTKKPNHTQQGKQPVSRDDPRQQTEWEEHIDKMRVKANATLYTTKVVASKKWGGEQ